MCHLSALSTFLSFRFASASLRRNSAALHVASSWVFVQTCHPFEFVVELVITVTVVRQASVSRGLLDSAEGALLEIKNSPGSVAFVVNDYLERPVEVL